MITQILNSEDDWPADEIIFEAIMKAYDQERIDEIFSLIQRASFRLRGKIKNAFSSIYVFDRIFSECV